MKDKWKVTVFDTGQWRYCQRALIRNEALCRSFEITWTMGYGYDAESTKAEKMRKKDSIALAREVCAFLNRKGAKS
jgi:hypothetical protein